MTPHGPDVTTFEKHSTIELKPFKLPDTMAFMFESNYLFKVISFLDYLAINVSYDGLGERIR